MIAAVFLSSGCSNPEDKAAWWRAEQQRIELNHLLALKKYRHEQADSRDFEQLAGLRRSMDALAPKLVSLTEQRSALANQIDSLQRQWVEFREARIRDQRQKALGTSFAEFGLVSGRKFVEVTVASIDDAGVMIRHADGSARLRYANLDSSQREFFGLDPELALAAEEKESQNSAEYEQWIERQVLAVHEKKRKDLEVASRRESAIRKNKSEFAARQVIAANAKPLSKPASNVGRRSYSRSSSYWYYSSYRPAYQYGCYNYTPYYACRPSMNVFPGRRITPTGYAPSVLPTRKSFADTTIPSIP